MKVGLTYDLKQDVPQNQGDPEDALEEYDSLETVDAIAAVLAKASHQVVKLGGGRQFLAGILHEIVDFVFNIAEGRGTSRSREAQVPAVLEMLDIPYCGADPQCLAVCLDKPLTKKLAALAGIPTPAWQVATCPADLETIDWSAFPFPAFVKPVFEGSSKGVRLASRVENREKMLEVVQPLLVKYHQPVMVEEFMPGDELTVGMVGNCPPQLVGIMRILPRTKMPYFIYSLEVKRDWERLVDYEVPARLKESTLQEVEALSRKAYEALGCRDFGRIDFRLDAGGRPHFLEINPLAGLNPHYSDLCIMAKKAGWTYEALITAIFESGVKRYGNATICCRHL